MDFRGGSGGRVWVGAIIRINNSELATRGGGKGWKEGFGWMSGRWDVTLYFFFIVSFDFSIPGIMTEGRKLKDIYNGRLKV